MELLKIHLMRETAWGGEGACKENKASSVRAGEGMSVV